jgi:cephalosporin-C deacetylase
VPERLAERGIVGLSISFGEVVSCRADKTEPGLLSEHPDDPLRFGYLHVIQLCLAAIDLLDARPYVDSSRIAVLGASQGGGLALITAALDRRVTSVASLVPFLCDIFRSQQVVANEPSAELRRWLVEHPGRCERVFTALQYYDAANFAHLIDVPTLVMLSPADVLVHRDAVALTISRLRGSPEVIEVPEGHIAPALLVHRDRVEAWLATQLAVA